MKINERQKQTILEIMEKFGDSIISITARSADEEPYIQFRDNGAIEHIGLDIYNRPVQSRRMNFTTEYIEIYTIVDDIKCLTLRKRDIT